MADMTLYIGDYAITPIFWYRLTKFWTMLNRPTLVIPKPIYRRGICFLPAAKQQIPRAKMPRFGMTSLWDFEFHTKEPQIDRPVKTVTGEPSATNAQSGRRRRTLERSLP